jgi:aminoglycoside 6-adenylyltransferase
LTKNISDSQTIINKLLDWANRKSDIRAMLLTSSRTNPKAPLDEFSDYDVIVVVKDIKAYLDDESWLEEYGKVLVLYRDPVEIRYGFERFIRVTQYESGLKIDFTFWPLGLMKHVAEMTELPDYIDDGYKVLLDKDGLTRGMKTPSCRAFIPKPPTEAEYRTFIEEFFSNAPYAAKQIRRGDFFPLKSMLNFLRYEKLCRVLEWKVEIKHDWSLKSGRYGKGLHKYLAPEIIDEIENTCAGSGEEDDWESLFRIIKLFRKVAKEVGNHLGYTYPADMDSRVVEYLQKVRGGELP